jgi:S-adenosylmethionine/arginine decarboxylase-like enzyme
MATLGQTQKKPTIGDHVPLHNQLLVNGYTNTPLKNEYDAIKWMQSLVDSIEMKIIQGPYSSYVTKNGNRGLTCMVMIETSHIALHIWDEPEPAEIQFDLYTCGDLPLDEILKKLEDELGLTDYHYIVLERETGFNVLERNRGGYNPRPIDTGEK